MVGGVAGVAAGKDAALVQLKWSRGHHGGDHGAVSVDQLLQQCLVGGIGEVGGVDLGALAVDGHGGRAGQLGGQVEVGILCLVGQLLLVVSGPLEVGVGWRAVAALSPILPVGAVHKLLLGVVAKHAGQLAEAGLYGRHAREGHTAATVVLALHRTHVAYITHTDKK